MRRFLSAPTLIAVLGLGGLALAQDGLIVDPWKRTVPNAVNAPPAPAGADRTRPTGGGMGSQGEPVISAPSVVTPSIEPLGPPLLARVDPWGVVPVGPVFTDEIVDPWKGSHLSALGAPERAPARRRGPTDWARAIEEIIDPWAEGPLAVVTDPLIVDPWAR
jgi:hypothetical protein